MTKKLDWHKDALCRQADPDICYPEKDGDRGELAKRLCGMCPVAAECLAFALANDEKFGIWGGLTVGERYKMQGRWMSYSVRRENPPPAEPKPVPTNECGTNRAYRRHLRNGEATCTACRAAHRRYMNGPKPSEPRQARCGTRAGYTRHRRRDEKPCAACTEANRAYHVEGERTRYPAQCGARAGYTRHRRRGETPCEPCIEANRAYNLEHDRRRRAEGYVSPSRRGRVAHQRGRVDARIQALAS